MHQFTMLLIADRYGDDDWPIVLCCVVLCCVVFEWNEVEWCGGDTNSTCRGKALKCCNLILVIGNRRLLTEMPSMIALLFSSCSR